MKTLNIIITIAIVTLSFNCFAGNDDPMTGSYTVGTNTGASFKTISAALTAVQHNGASGPVTFIVDKDIYNQHEIIAAIVNTPVSGNVEFISSADQNNTAGIADEAKDLASK